MSSAPVSTKEFSLAIEQCRDRMAALLPKHLTPERMIRITQAAYFKTPKLQQCHRDSIIASVLEACELGLEPNGAQRHAYLIPYKTKLKVDGRETWVYLCQLQVSYLGYLELARRSGEFAAIETNLVRKGDVFALEYVPEAKFIHRPMLNGNGPREITHAYAYAKLHNGSTVFEIMEVGEINHIRSFSKSPDSPAWVNHFGEMAKKTVLKRLTKRQAQSAQIVRANEIDEREFDLNRLPAPSGPRLSREEQLMERLNQRAKPPAALEGETESEPDDFDQFAAEQEEFAKD